MKSLFSPVLILCAAGLALLLSGCGGGGGGTNGGPQLITTPYSRNTGSVAQSLDLAGALNNVDAPAGKEYLILISSENGPVYYLNELEVPSTTAGFYPLSAGTTFTRGPSGGSSPMLANNEMALAGLARALARGTRGIRSGTRDTIPINFIGENGIQWVGSYAYTVSGSAVNSVLTVTGTRNSLTITVSIESDSDSTLTETSATTDYTFTYNYRITGMAGTDAIDLTATGDGDGDDTINFISLAGSGHQEEQTEYEIAVNDRVSYRSNTALNHSHLTTDGSNYQVTTSYTADTWLFAPDGYWVHAITTIDTDVTGSEFSLSVVGSDGYGMTFNGTTGTLTDANQNVLANLSYDDETGIVKVDYTFAMEVQGAPDYIEIDLYML
ncbi:MAG: hypothetical protein ACYDCO_23565 [Armatimonadota bacterium]